MSNNISGFSQIPNLEPGGRSGAPRRTTEAGGDFLDTLKSTLEQVEQLQGDAQSRVSGLLNGNGEDVHSAMIAVEKADLAFQLMMQVRNKIVQAYQEVARMPF